MSEENVELVRDGYDDFNSGNIPGLIARLADDVEWVEPGGGNAPSGTFRGPDSVANDVFPSVAENSDEFSCKAESARDEGDTVIVDARFAGRSKSGTDLDVAAEHVWQIQDGKVTEFENKLGDPDGWAAAWS